MSFLQELTPGIHRWSEYSEEKRLNFYGYYLVHKGQSVIIDPPELSDDAMHELRDLIKANSASPLKAILLTNVHHERISLKLKEALAVPIYIHEYDKELLDFLPDKTFHDNETLFCGLKTIHLQDQKSPGETIFFLEDQKKLFVGDALIGKVPGKLNLLPSEKYSDIHKAKEALRVLKSYDFDCLLLGDGEPILNGAKKKLEEFLD
ncbi:MAG: hypothetical protein IID18_03840 [Nitrospinae bacterium]|nr:hypothetical protein [Nitrospinota bacterium]